MNPGRNKTVLMQNGVHLTGVSAAAVAAMIRRSERPLRLAFRRSRSAAPGQRSFSLKVKLLVDAATKKWERFDTINVLASNLNALCSAIQSQLQLLGWFRPNNGSNGACVRIDAVFDEAEKEWCAVDDFGRIPSVAELKLSIAQSFDAQSTSAHIVPVLSNVVAKPMHSVPRPVLPPTRTTGRQLNVVLLRESKYKRTMVEWVPFDGMYSVRASSVAGLCAELHKAITLTPSGKLWLNLATVGIEVSRCDPATGLWSTPSEISDIVDGEILRVHQLQLSYVPFGFKVGEHQTITPEIRGGVAETTWPVDSFGLAFALGRNTELDEWLAINPANGELSGQPMRMYAQDKALVLVSQLGATTVLPVSIRVSRPCYPEASGQGRHANRRQSSVPALQDNREAASDLGTA